MGNKFKVKLKITGFELEVEGSRDDVSLMAQAVGQQVSGLLIPASTIVEGEVVEVKDIPTPDIQPKPRKKRARKSPVNSHSIQNNSKQGGSAIDWKHDPIKWGHPQRDWSTSDKSIWLLFVVAQATGTSELTGGQIATTFNKHFRQSREINTGQVNRDLGKAKGSNGGIPLVIEDTTQNPSAWCLTSEGIKRAEEIIQQSTGNS